MVGLERGTVPVSYAIEKQPGYLKGELIYPLEDRPTPECHASTIAETREGTLAAAWFGGEREGSPDVGIWLSRNEDGKWSRPVQVADGEWTLGRRSTGSRGPLPCWNPVLFQPRNGPLILFFKVGPTPREWWGEMMISDDDGRSWEDRRALPNGGIGPAKNKPVELDDGTIICPSSGEHGSWRVHFELTRAGTCGPLRSRRTARALGWTWYEPPISPCPHISKPRPQQASSASVISVPSVAMPFWEVIGPLHDDTIFPSIQPSILTHPGGRLQILCRTRGKGVISESWSSDGGRTWSEMTATSLPNPDSGIDAATLTDGRHLVVYNPITKGRNRLSVALSEDGKDWREALKLEDEDEGEYSYPAVIQSSDGEVHVTYTFRRASIKHVTLDPEALS